MVPQGALVLDNHNGTAPGLIIEKNGKTAILLPGPPNELKPMFEEEVFPYLRKKQPEIIYSQMVKICSIGESQVAEEIQEMCIRDRFSAYCCEASFISEISGWAIRE